MLVLDFFSLCSFTSALTFCNWKLTRKISAIKNFAVGMFTLGNFAAGNFAVRKFHRSKFRRKEISPQEILPYGYFAVRKCCRKMSLPYWSFAAWNLCPLCFLPSTNSLLKLIFLINVNVKHWYKNSLYTHCFIEIFGPLNLNTNSMQSYQNVFVEKKIYCT